MKKTNPKSYSFSVNCMKNLLVILTLIATSNLLADTVQLKNGKTYAGKIISQTRTSVKLRLTNDQVKIFPKKTINKLKFGPVRNLKKEREAKRKKAELERQRIEQLKQAKLAQEKQKAEQKRLQQLKAERERQKENKRKQAAAQRIKLPPRHFISIKPEVGLAQYDSFISSIINGFKNFKNLISPITNGNGAMDYEEGIIHDEPNAQLHAMVLDWVWNDFMVSMAYQGLDQVYHYKPLAYRSNDFIRNGQLTDKDPLIERMQLDLGWSFWRQPKWEVALIAGSRRNRTSIESSGFLFNEFVGTNPSLVIPNHYSYGYDYKGAAVGLQFQSTIAPKWDLNLKVMFQKSSGKFYFKELNLLLNGASTLVQEGLTLTGDTKLQGFDTSMATSYQLSEQQRIGITLGFSEFDAQVENVFLEIVNTKSKGGFQGPSEFILYNKITNLLGAPKMRGKEKMRSISLFYEYRLSFI